MNQEPEILAYRPERWLILSPDVAQAIAASAGPPDGLAALRLSCGLVKAVDPGNLAAELFKLARQACTIHLVFERLDAQAIALCGELVAGDPDIQLHDFADSPSGVLQSLRAPDAAIVDLLGALNAGARAAALHLAALPGHPDFVPRQRAALKRWEMAARAEYGDGFDRLYSARPIPWLEVLVEEIVGDGAIASVAKSGVRLGVGAVRWLGQRAAAAMAPGSSALATVGMSASGAAAVIEWGPIDTGRGIVTVTVESRIEDGHRCIEVDAVWAGGQPGNIAMTLVFEAPVPFRFPVGRKWDRGAGSEEVATMQRSIDDPVGALWALLQCAAAPPAVEFDDRAQAD